METLTLAEIEARYPNEWVVLSDPEVDDHLEVLRGTVVSHGSNQDEVYQKAAVLRLQHSAFLYTGSVPDNMVVVL